MDNDTLALLRAIPCLGELPAEMLERLAGISRPLALPVESVVFREGEMPSCLYLLDQGLVALSAATPNGEVALIEILAPREAFVLATIMLAIPYAMSARTLQSTRLLCIDANELRAMAAADSTLALALTRAVSRQYRLMVSQIADLKLRSVTQRLARYLVTLQGQHPPRTEIRLPYDKRLLAARLGTRPEHLSRAFAALRAYGVTTHGSHVSVAEPGQLIAFAAVADPSEPMAMNDVPSAITPAGFDNPQTG